ncbi:hypothetical protein RHMOL_Rhmol02G0201400 [Rhododendron molle]|uniref:Uncharacterized protein n=1 Tax=Rhododendron molle TaxID=49168 RepID=A0ACC0PTH6_RHOML|nr:hypothetical protein RHMOL_Rhmol02G0201400 [Rhododendron molle]
MVVPVPFRRWVLVKYRGSQTIHGGFYCLLPIQGQRVIAAVASYRHGGQLEYKAYSMFVREYGDVLGLGDNLVWAVRADLVKWLDALVHNSFLRYSTPGVDRCWYLRRISQFLAFAPTMVVDAVMQNGWREFRTAHGIAPNYKLIFMCHLIIGCLPSTILSNLPLIKSGYCCIPKVNYLQEFQTRLQPMLEDLNLQTISIRMGNKSWTISVDNGDLNAAMFNPVLNALQLQVHDYVFIAMVPNLEVRVVILDAGNDKERIYDWL